MIRIIMIRIIKNSFFFLFIFLCLYAPLISTAQEAKIQAQSEYYAAEQAYNYENYQSALDHLYRSETLAGNNHLIQYLRVKVYYSDKSLYKAREALEVFQRSLEADATPH